MKKKDKIKLATHIVYKLIYNLRLESVFYYLSYIHPIFRKFIPQPSYYKNTDIRIVRRNGVHFKLNLSDYMQWHVFAGIPDNSWQYAKSYITRGAVFLDIGANCGAFSLQLAYEIQKKKVDGCKILAFEPNPFILNYLSTNIKLNTSLEKIIQVIPVGIGSNDEIVGFQFQEDNSGGGRVVKNEKGNIAVRKLDSILAELRINSVNFIKIDVEGYEPFVLKGAVDTLQKNHPALYIEITDSWFKNHGFSSMEILRWIEQKRYQLFVDHEKSTDSINLTKIPSWLEELNQYNALAVPIK